MFWIGLAVGAISTLVIILAWAVYNSWVISRRMKNEFPSRNKYRVKDND